MQKFRKSAVVGLFAAALALGSMPGCTTGSSSSSAGSASVKDGEYSATAQGFGNGDVTVTITVKDGKITDAKVDASSQSADYGQKAADTLAQEIVDGQTYDIDVASGATATRDAVSTAAKDAMEQAGFNTDSTAEKGEDETKEADVLVIGMGASGITAAVRAAEAGASVIGVEATDTLGGFGNAAQGMFAVGSVEQKERYGDDEPTDEQYWYEHMMSETNNMGNGPLLREFVSEAKNTVSYMLNHGVKFFLSEQPQQIAHFDTEVEYHRWNNAEPFKYLGQALEDNNVDVEYNTTATKLITDSDGNVTGAECTKEDGGTLTVNAKSVIVSTGGFANDADLMKQTLGESTYNNMQVLAGTYYPGVDMLWEAGAGEGALTTMNHGVTVEGVDDETVSQVTLNSPVLWVNGNGTRFMNEDDLKDTVVFTSDVVAQGGIAYTIIDQDTVDQWTDTSAANTGTWVHYWDRFGIVDENGNPTIYHATYDPDTWKSDFQKLQDAGQGGVFDTIEEAAEFIGCSAEDLQATIDTYNTAVETKNDTEFYKDADDLKWEVKNGPFYVTKGHAGCLGALGGVNTTTKLEVLNDNYKVIKNLYATGNNVSGISYGTYQDVEGVGLGWSLTSGRLAGIYAAENAGYTTEMDTTELTDEGQQTMEEATATGMNGTQEQ